jgi:uncharacterized Zn-binding protein involved in type VI secretion
MPGPIVNASASVICSHGGSGTLSASNTKVLLSGQPAITLADACAIASCSFSPPIGNGPCVNGQWIAAATRVKVNGQPVVLVDSQSTCTPTGTSMAVTSTQSRVSAV